MVAKPKQTALVLGAYQFPKWWSIYATVCKRLRENEYEVFFVNIAELNTPSWETAFSTFARCREKTTPLDSELRNMGVSTMELKKASGVKTHSTDGHEPKHALLSQIGSYLRDDNPDLSSGYGAYLAKGLLSQAQCLIEFFEGLHNLHGFDEVVIPNGRLFLQAKLSKHLSDHHPNIKQSFTEVGLPGSGYFHEDYRIHDRVRSQEHAKELSEGLSPDFLMNFATSWLKPRMRPGGMANEYSKRFNVLGTGLDKSSKVTNVFFTSSSDEFWSLGPEWDGDLWEDQYHAFESIARHLVSRGEKCIVRVHPNLVNKSKSHFARELTKIQRLSKISGLQVIWHTDRTNSYDLVNTADRVFVSRSMLGFESQLLGTPVWVTSKTNYDLLADVKFILSPEQIRDSNLKIENPEQLGSAIHIYSLKVRDKPYLYGETFFSKMDLRLGSGGMRLSYLPGKFDWRHILQVLRYAFRKPMRDLEFRSFWRKK